MRRLAKSALVLSILHGAGCSICCAPFDNEYATYGTAYPRVDQVNGRVGSPFSDPNVARVASNQVEQVDAEEVYVPPVTSTNTSVQSDEPMTIEEGDFETPLQFD